jgi:2-dehydro-3-deoxyphosphogalactonate aldolase
MELRQSPQRCPLVAIAVLPAGTLVLPVGGIEAGNIRAWAEAEAGGFGIGSAIYKPGDNADSVAAKAARLLAALHG